MFKRVCVTSVSQVPTLPHLSKSLALLQFSLGHGCLQYSTETVGLGSQAPFPPKNHSPSCVSYLSIKLCLAFLPPSVSVFLFSVPPRLSFCPILSFWIEA